ncbi:alpha/beta fold hydrolase [Moorena sp. SIO4G3]|uniref:alpha/beta fold hydrolase n=1 Tax=Moorena sp. SIO4G3 TaxID=2607821 RepID=UPI0014293FC1|nr:alpha/beta fold hydrolase [Moorena sp. SIO4G3]NEO78686.1 alpha/beta fold hydrolase [Moorena sp. SIO4G3]
MSISEQSIEVGSWEWFYREAKAVGDSRGVPIILLHGLPSQSFCWCEIMPDLAKVGYDAIAPDWLGSGLSAKPDRLDFPYTPDAFIEALGDFLKHLEIERFSLVVQGFLASVGLQYALRHSDQIERLVILNTPVSSAAKLPSKMQQWGWPFIGDMLTQDPLLVDRTLEGGSRYRIEDNYLDLYRKPFLKSSDPGRSLVATIKNMQMNKSMAEIESGFRNWDKPTLIVWGLKDPWLPVEQAEQFANQLKNKELVKLEEAGHYPQEHWSKEISEILVPFLRRKA